MRICIRSAELRLGVTQRARRTTFRRETFRTHKSAELLSDALAVTKLQCNYATLRYLAVTALVLTGAVTATFSNAFV